MELIQSAKARQLNNNNNDIGEFCHRCFTLLALKDQSLRRMAVTKIIIPLSGFKSEPRLVQIFNHICDKPWRVITSYAYITKHSAYISLYLVCPIKRTLKTGEPICHISFVQPEEVIVDLKCQYPYFYSDSETSESEDESVDICR